MNFLITSYLKLTDIGYVVFEYLTMDDFKKLSQVSKGLNIFVKSKFGNFYSFFNDCVPALKKKHDILQCAIINNRSDVFKYIFLRHFNEKMNVIELLYSTILYHSFNSMINIFQFKVDIITYEDILNLLSHCIQYKSHECFIYLIDFYYNKNFDKSNIEHKKNIEKFLYECIPWNNIHAFKTLYEKEYLYKNLTDDDIICLSNMFIPYTSYTQYIAFFQYFIDFITQSTNYEKVYDKILIYLINDNNNNIPCFNYLIIKYIENNIIMSNIFIIEILKFMFSCKNHLLESFIDYISKNNIHMNKKDIIHISKIIFKNDLNLKYIKILMKSCKN